MHLMVDSLPSTDFLGFLGYHEGASTYQREFHTDVLQVEYVPGESVTSRVYRRIWMLFLITTHTN